MMEMFTDKEINQVEEAERFHELIANGCTHWPDNKKAITGEFNTVLYLERLMKTAKQIASSNDDISKLVDARTSAGNRVVRFNRLGHALLVACNDYRDNFFVGSGQDEKPRYGHHKFHPYLDVALKAIAEAEAGVAKAAANKDNAALHKLIADLAAEVRVKSNTRQFKQKVRNFERNAEAKLVRALLYLLSLFKKRSRLLILRVDLYVREEGKAWSYTAEADEAFDKFAEALAGSKIVPDVMGWMSAREDGIERGRHVHVLVAVDGNEHHAGANLTKMLGEYWVKECVGSDKIGSYFNCFALVDKYTHLGIGMVHCMDAKKLLGLYYATRYLCKSEVQVIATGKRTRNFRRGEEDKDYVRLGAPRAKDDGLSLARQVLFGQMRLIKMRKSKAAPSATHQAPTGQYSSPP
jgi:hypothetical protein